MRFIPLGVMAVSLVSGYTLLQSRMGVCEEKIKNMDIVQSKLSADSGEVRISQARTEEKIEAIVELLKDIKNKK